MITPIPAAVEKRSITEAAAEIPKGIAIDPLEIAGDAPCTRPEYVQCSLPGCGEVFPAQQYWGKTQHFCCDEHRKKMRRLLVHARWVYENTGCRFALHVLRYLQILCTGMPPPSHSA